MRLLDRYVLRNFLRAYLYCLAAFFSIWLVFDFSDKVATFLDADASFGTMARYYLTQAPEILVIVLPIALLLSLLYCLSRMSRANEIVSMLVAGISLPRLLVPLFAIGLLTTALSAALNYSLAPHAERARRAYDQELRADDREPGIYGHIFRNRADNRTWFIQRFRPEGNELQTVQVLQQDEKEEIVTNYLAVSAAYRETERAWELKQVKIVKYDEQGNIAHEQTVDSLLMPQWSETPFRLASSDMRAERLSLPELRDYLRFNADFPPVLLAPFATHLQHRLALPWTCLVVVLIAAPLGIGFARTGLLSSVAAAIALVFLQNFLSHFFLALGEGGRISPWAAAWSPNILFAAVGLFLLYLRSTNREASSLNPFAMRRLSLA